MSVSLHCGYRWNETELTVTKFWFPLCMTATLRADHIYMGILMLKWKSVCWIFSYMHLSVSLFDWSKKISNKTISKLISKILNTSCVSYRHAVLSVKLYSTNCRFSHCFIMALAVELLRMCFKIINNRIFCSFSSLSEHKLWSQN